MSVIVEYIETVEAEGGRRKVMAGERFEVSSIPRAKYFHPEAVIRTVNGRRYEGEGSLAAYTETGKSIGRVRLYGADLDELHAIQAEQGAAVPAEDEATDAPAVGPPADGAPAVEGAVDAPDAPGTPEATDAAAGASTATTSRSRGSGKGKGSNVGTPAG
jgi:hypothetical protein